ncbi:hypothetical protein [Nostoc sp. FACHB-110]|uniref:hypothetical protein n=1 Tax=Nostoc sp. FACHB-110 TaxID=2692834 RepID=UPI001686EF41|nr:hypothetical protein [Nostoc sp. FACHB-110]MBD2437326.1 hypothetical protein [Nostoc sp. FACHB-110]
MDYLSEAHQELTNSQQSDLVVNFDAAAMDLKVAAIGLGLVLGVGASAMAWKGESSDRVYFCLKSPTHEFICEDLSNRPYRMTAWQWQQWGMEGRPKAVVMNRTIIASNPYKPYWAGGAFLSFAVAGWMLRHLQHTEKKLAKFEAIKDKHDIAQAELKAKISLMDNYRELAIKEVELQADLELIAGDRSIDLQKAEILAETEIEVIKLEASDALFEAKTAGMTDEQKEEYINFLRSSQTPYLQGTQTLEQIVNPGDKVEGTNQTAIAAADKYKWMQNTIGYPTLIFGGMGAGKSWTTREIIWHKRKAGWNRIIALDPHGTPVEWQGVELITGYEEISQFMQWYLGEMRDRYKAYRKSGMVEEQWTQHLRDTNQHFCVVAEEFTTWTDNIVEPMPDNCEDEKWKPDPDFVGKWFRCAMTESRKQLMIPLFVAHDRTMEILAKAKGLSRLRDSSLLEIELIPDIDEVTAEAKASGKGAIKLPGHGQWLPIELPPLTHKRIDFRPEGSTAVTPTERPKQPDPFEGVLDNVPTIEMSQMAHAVLAIINAGNQPVSFESIRKSRKWNGTPPKTEIIRGALMELIRLEKIQGDAELGYKILGSS